MDALLACSAIIAAPMFVVVFAGCVWSYLSEGETWLYIPFGLVISFLGSAFVGLLAGSALVLGAHAGVAGTRGLLAGSLELLLYAALWLAIVVLASQAVLLGFERLALAAKGDLPVPLLAFLDDCTARGVLRRRRTLTSSNPPRCAAFAYGGGIFQSEAASERLIPGSDQSAWAHVSATPCAGAR